MLRLLPLALAAACAVPTPYQLPLFGGGYRAEGDQCRRVGEDVYTNQFLGDASDLVACPAGMENLGVFALDTGGQEVARVPGYVLYSVPVR
ncbi:hypothetical protein [Salipiger sp. IMCC34102]|uniref:hypothetical protein n=1 Tax=Salipiger sp. IMCC34102 TaxID=2510647 RepID=UPI001F5DDEF7|nr:hypothetical protein [Salipiger sp. IMCC34102]